MHASSLGGPCLTPTYLRGPLLSTVHLSLTRANARPRVGQGTRVWTINYTMSAVCVRE